jgi:hypothetical protein
MPINKATGGGGGGTKIQPAQMPDLYDPNKTIRHVYDCNTTAGGTAPMPATTSNFNSATSTQTAMEDNRPCVFELTSSTTANSSCAVGFVVAAAPPASNPTLTVYFKTPAVMDANTSITIGNNSQGSTDKSGLEIVGSTLQGKVVVGGTTTQSGGTYTVSANTWYIARIIYTGLSSAVCKLYSATGTELYSFTITVTIFVGTAVGLRATNSGTVAVSMCKVDFIEIITPISNRFYLPI